jgi:acetyl-CoA hydrolase
VPVGISSLDGLFAAGRLDCDVVFVQVSPADGEGWHRLGLGIDTLPRCIERARVVLAEVNDRLPVTAGPYRLHASQISASVRTSRSLVEVPMVPPSPTELTVAAQVAELVPDGATVQFGIGRLPDAIATALVGHRGLAVHSGLVTDALVELVEAGAVDTGRTSVIGAAVGTPVLYDLLARSPWIEVHPYSHTHDPATLAALPHLVAINSALEVDLTGQIGAEVVGGAHLGAVGGQSDFLRGAARSAGGLPIVALVSTTGGGSRSRIVEHLDGGVVTTARSDAGLVVTEHGVADLRGRTLRQRAEALVAVAGPAFRNDLAAAAADEERGTP